MRDPAEPKPLNRDIIKPNLVIWFIPFTQYSVMKTKVYLLKKAVSEYFLCLDE